MNYCNNNGNSWEIGGDWYWNDVATPTATTSTSNTIPTNAMNETLYYPAESIAATLSAPMPFIHTSSQNTTVTVPSTSGPFLYDGNLNTSASTAMVVPSNNGGIAHPSPGIIPTTIVSSWSLPPYHVGIDTNATPLYNTNNNTAIPNSFVSSSSSSSSDFSSPASKSTSTATEGMTLSKSDSYNQPGKWCVLEEEMGEEEISEDIIEEQEIQVEDIQEEQESNEDYEGDCIIEEQEILVEDIQEEQESNKDYEGDLIEHRKADYKLSNDCTISETKKSQLKKAKKEMHNNTSDGWNDMFQLLLEYKVEHNNIMVPKIYDKNPQFGLWVNTLRTQYSKKQLSVNRAKCLEFIGFARHDDGIKQPKIKKRTNTQKDRNDSNQKKWTAMFQLLVKYKSECGNTSVPVRYNKNPQLGRWVNKQRHWNSRKQLASSRVLRLDSIGFTWYLRKKFPWDSLFQLLRDYKAEHGNTLVPRGYAKNPQLGRWVNSQRYLHSKKLIPFDRVVRLESIGFAWTLQRSFVELEKWDGMFKLLGEYKDKQYDTLVPQNCDESPDLGRWAATQRVLHSHNELPRNHTLLLQSIGFVFDTNKSDWRYKHRQLSSYQEKHEPTSIL